MVLLYTGATWVVITWHMAVIFLLLTRGRDVPLRWVARLLWAELRPFYLPAMTVGLAYEAFTGNWSAFILSGVADPLYWLLFKDIGGDDDRWRRRARAASETVARFGARLRAVPVAEGA